MSVKYPMVKIKISGVTLIELMISLVLGLLIMAAVFSVYVGTLQSSALSLNASRLNQESEAILNVIANELRRSGYDGNYNSDAPYANDFNDVSNATYLQVKNYLSGTNNCIVYTYDRDNSGNSDGSIQGEELKGFRHNQASGAVEMRISTSSGSFSDFNDCAKGEWRQISDHEVVNVTKLEFSLADSQCINNSALVAVSGATCFPGGGTMTALSSATPVSAATPWAIVSKRRVSVDYEAALVADNLVVVSSASPVVVKIRNDLLFEAP